MNNRRRIKRIKLDSSVKISVHLSPVSPFIGEELSAHLVNLSAEGIGLRFQSFLDDSTLKKGMRIKIHFRLPGGPLRECSGVVQRITDKDPSAVEIGIRFTKTPLAFRKYVREMIRDNEFCERRIRTEENPWCNPACSYFQLCRKPIRPPQKKGPDADLIEIALQNATLPI